MAVCSTTKYLGITASVVVIIQGLVWTCLTLMAILVHAEAWTPKISIINYGERLTYEIVDKYLNGKSAEEALGISTIIFGPKELFICNIVYLILSILWIGAASFQLWAIFQPKSDTLKYGLLTFGVTTIIVCVYDVIMTCLFANDYNAIVGKVNSISNWNVDHSFAVLACGILMTICARGFTLLLLNLVLGILMTKLAFNTSPKVPNTFSVIDAFGDVSTMDPPFAPKNIDSPSEMFGTFHGLPRLPPIQSTNERLTNLTKVNRNSPISPPTRSALYKVNRPAGHPIDTSSVNSSIRQPRFQTANIKNRYQQQQY